MMDDEGVMIDARDCNKKGGKDTHRTQNTVFYCNRAVMRILIKLLTSCSRHH